MKKRFALFAYWTWLTIELLLSDPWAFFSQDLAQHPPVDTHSTLMSLLIHMSTFTVLSLLLNWNFGKLRKGFRPGIYRVAICYALVTEVLQIWVPRRWPSFEDAAFNLIGLTIGYFVFHRLFPKPEAKTPVDSSTLPKAA